MALGPGRSGLIYSGLENGIMAYHPARRLPAKSPELTSGEIAALRDVTEQRAVDAAVLDRLHKLGLAEQKAGKWTVTQAGHIRLMFLSAR